MGGNRFIIAVLGVDDSVAEAIATRLRNAWPHPHRPDFPVKCGHGLEPAEMDTADGLVLVADTTADAGAVISLLTDAEEMHLPALALLEQGPAADNPFEFAGALVRLREQADTLLAATLQGLAHRQSEVRKLRNEIAIARRHQGGLRGQMVKVHEELQLAAVVQREFLPRELPCLHGVHFAAMWRPAHYVSGDLYDVRRLDEDRVGLFLADSIGHGVPAALMTMIIYRSLTMKEVDDTSYRILPPAEVLARLNTDMIARQGRTTRFATAVYAVVDCRRRTMTLAGAGHPPPLLLRADGTTDSISTPGGLLGIFEDEAYGQVELELEVGDRLLLYSDGFEQAFPDLDGTTERCRPSSTRYLAEFQKQRTATGPQALIDRIGRAVDDQQGSLHQADDLTLVCMEAGELVQEASREQRTSNGVAAQQPL